MPKHAKAFCKENVPLKLVTACSVCQSAISGADDRGLQTALRLHYKLKHKDFKPDSAYAADRVHAPVGRLRRGRWQDFDAPKVDQ